MLTQDYFHNDYLFNNSFNFFFFIIDLNILNDKCAIKSVCQISNNIIAILDKYDIPLNIDIIPNTTHIKSNIGIIKGMIGFDGCKSS